MGANGINNVKAQLEGLNVRPNPALGQNFLCDDSAIELISRAASYDGQHELMEIGPGLGALTGALIGLVPRVTAVEIDANMVRALKARFSGEAGLDIIQSDILKLDIPSVMPGTFIAAGNLPYYITTPIVTRLLCLSSSIPCMTFMVQKEAARRFFAAPRTKLYGPLSIMAQYYYDIQSLLSLSPASYYPQPDVDSEVVRLIRRDMTAKLEPKRFFGFIEALFAMRRKTIYNNLKPILGSRDAICDALSSAGIAENARAEELSIDKLAQLAALCI